MARWSCRFSHGLARECWGQRHNDLQATLMTERAALDIDAGKAQHHHLERLGLRYFGLGLGEQRPTVGNFGMPAPVAEQPVMTYAYKPVWERVQQKPPKELRAGQAHDFQFVAMGVVAPAKTHLTVLKAHQALVGDSHPVGVAPEIV